VQKFSWSLAEPDSDKAASVPAVTDGVDAISSQFDASVYRATTDQPAPVVTAQTDAAPTRSVVASAEGPALTRRELREREAKAAARPKLFAAAAPSATKAPKATPTTARPRRSASKASIAAAGPARTTPKSAKRPAGFKHRVLSNLATVGAMAGVGLILISTTVPANAFVRPETSESMTLSSTSSEAKTQELQVNAAAAPAITRDGYTVVSPVRQVQSKVGKRTYSFTNNPTGAVQWPFPGGSPITSGFGPRQVSGCGYCSTNHSGLDFTPGSGTPIQSIAGGVVVDVNVSGGGFGNSVVVEHVVNGQRVRSLYAHMQYGSIQVAVGQQIGVGDMIGAVGSTGNSTGAHLHLEVHLEGTPIDPYAWLQANAG
jgi:murein DD-endopeptidase MepM/ murein hydrolase activator NlpD